MKYLVIVTMMLPNYTESIIHQLILAGFEVGSGAEGAPCNGANGTASSLLSLSLTDKYVNDEGVSEVITGALNKASAKFYSVVIIPQGNKTIRLANSNIKLPTITKPKTSNILKLVPKAPSKLEEKPNDIIDDPAS